MANKVYTARETAIVFADTGGDYAIDMSGLLAGDGVISARADRGTGSTASWYEWRATYQMATAGVIGEYGKVYVATSDGTNPDGEVGTVKAALDANKERNLILAGHVVVDTTSTDTDITGSGVVFIPTRYFSIGFVAPVSDALRTSTAVHSITLTPIPDEIQ